MVAATIDPNPAVAGHGLDGLKAAGLETSVGVCEVEARRLNEGFARWSQHKRPLVLMKVAMTLDGRIAPPAGNRAACAILDNQRSGAGSRAAAALAGRRGHDGRGHGAGRRPDADRPERAAPAAAITSSST